MAENTVPTDDELQSETGLTRRARVKSPARRIMPRRPARATTPTATAPRARVRPLRNMVIIAMVGGLIATVALPAYGAWRAPEEAAVTLQQVAADDAQSLVIASDTGEQVLDRGGYSATSQEEIDKKKAEEAAAARAREMAKVKASTASSGVHRYDLSLTAPGSGEVRWPVTNFTYTAINMFHPPMRPNHNGFDMLCPAGTPIFAAAAGVVRISQESYNGYGVAVMIDSVVGGQQVSTLYGHMTYGSRLVSTGQTVSAGQVIGAVGSTGSSTANHLHFEVKINGGLVDPLAWLNANAG